MGLAIGMAACIVISLFVYYERSFDNMHSKNIYRLNEVQKFPGMVSSQKVASQHVPHGADIKKGFSGDSQIYQDQLVGEYHCVGMERKEFICHMTFRVDSAFLDIFDFPLKEGNRQTALWSPHSAVLTESAAHKFFGSDNPMGKTIYQIGDDTTAYTVTGILKDIPSNSQFQFEALFSFNTIYKPEMMNAGVATG